MQRYECVYLHECTYIFITEKCATSKYIQIKDQKKYILYNEIMVWLKSIHNVKTYLIINLNNEL